MKITAAKPTTDNHANRLPCHPAVNRAWRYAAYLHARFTAGWKGGRLAWLSVVGFGAVIFTYWGVNFILSGLHSYG